MSLKKYLSKRILKKSLEPAAKLFKRKAGKLHFVVQKHAASHLHYDFRLEVDGVLKSWAVPKGPSLDPSQKRLSMMVEDHPYEYRNFEGIIPSGYGAGTVLIWDEGTYTVDDEPSTESEQSMREGLKKGSLHFTLEGKKLKGEFSLVKMKKEGNEWLLIKKKDSFASKNEITQKSKSVISNKTIEEITGQHSGMPHHLKPMLATLIDEPFDSPDWLFEIKWDGFRALAELNSKIVDLYSRNFISYNERFPLLITELKKQKLNAILDGEIVALNEKGLSQFQLLQNNLFDQNIYYYVFDILYLNGKDLTTLPLVKRKEILKGILKSTPHVRYTEHVESEGKNFFKTCKQHGCEGIIGKKKDSLYHSGERSKEWVKIKAEMQQEVVICGFTEPRRTRKNFGALIIGVYKNNRLHFAGHVGGGFTEKKLKEVKELLSPLSTKECPFKNPPRTNTKVTWIKPKYMCEVKFKEWTNEGIMRQPIFLGIRTDKPVKSVIKENPISKKTLLKKEYDFITHPDKLFWEKEKITKGNVLAYYENIAPYILPYLKDRPESLRRFPNGANKPGFFQKNLIHYPEWISTLPLEQSGKIVNYLVINDLDSLLYAVNLGCIEIHPWLSKRQHLENPDFLLFDLDPVDISFEAVIETAKVLHSILEELDIPSFCKTSGSRGIHICIPLKAKYTYEQSKQCALIIANLVHREISSFTSLERKPSNRKKKVYIDCFQNNIAQTMAAPYCLRAKPGAPVSTPVEWKEVKKGLNPFDFNYFTIQQRLTKKGDLFKPVLQKGIDMNKVIKKIRSMQKN